MEICGSAWKVETKPLRPEPQMIPIWGFGMVSGRWEVRYSADCWARMYSLDFLLMFVVVLTRVV